MFDNNKFFGKMPKIWGDLNLQRAKLRLANASLNWYQFSKFRSSSVNLLSCFIEFSEFVWIQIFSTNFEWTLNLISSFSSVQENRSLFVPWLSSVFFITGLEICILFYNIFFDVSMPFELWTSRLEVQGLKFKAWTSKLIRPGVSFALGSLFLKLLEVWRPCNCASD